MDQDPLVNRNDIKNPGKKEKSNAEGRFSEMENLFILSVTESNLVYHRRFAPSIDSFKLDKKEFLYNIFDSNVSVKLTIFFKTSQNDSKLGEKKIDKTCCYIIYWSSNFMQFECQILSKAVKY